MPRANRSHDLDWFGTSGRSEVGREIREAGTARKRVPPGCRFVRFTRVRGALATTMPTLESAECRVRLGAQPGQNVQTSPWIPIVQSKIQVPPTKSWEEYSGSWSGFCEAVHRSIGKRIGGGVLTYSRSWRNRVKKVSP